MSNLVGVVGSPQNTPTQTATTTGAGVPAPANGLPAAGDFKSQTAQSLASQNAALQTAATQTPTPAADPDPPISPRIVVDPLAGPITEFLTTSGQIQAQTPSAAVVAYLRAGLTSSGTPKPTVDPKPTPTVTSTSTTGETNNPEKSSVVA
jgi:hypothetical protein